jgi:hypothetical protein
MTAEKTNGPASPVFAVSEGSDKAAAWDIASLIDLEVAVRRDEGGKLEDLKRRDREFFRSLESAGTPANLLKSRSWVLWRWLQFRKPELTADGSTPGGEVAGWLDTIKHVGFCVLFLIGVSWVWGNLNRDTVSVLRFAAITTGIPFGLSCVGFYLLVSHRMPRLRAGPSIFGGIVASVLTRGVKNWVRHLGTCLDADRVRTVSATVGALRIRLADRGGIVVSRLASATHLLGLGMVIGISVALFWFKTFSDQNYGWMTHASWMKEATVGRIVRTIAAPWRPFACEGRGYPTADQIARSHFFRDDEPRAKDHSANETWSSFLLLTSLVWGVLPRVGLFLVGKRDHRRALAAETFTQHRFDDPWRRMTRREVVIGHPESRQDPADESGEIGNDPEKPDEADGQRSILLVPAEIAAEKLVELFRAALDHEHALAVTETRAFPELPNERDVLLDEFGTPPSVGTLELLLLQEAFMPPTRGLRRFLSSCRERFPKASIRVILIGKSHPECGWDAPSESDRSVWSDNITSLGDPRLSLVLLESPSEK